MDKNEAERILKKYSKKNSPSGRVPTMEECVEALKHPEKDDPKIKDFLNRRPGLEKDLRGLLRLEKQATKEDRAEAACDKVLKGLEKDHRLNNDAMDEWIKALDE